MPRSEIARPSPPIVGKVTHHSVELYWEEELEEAKSNLDGKNDRIKICIQEEDRPGTWGNVYTGYSGRHTIDGLEPLKEYKYRIRFMSNTMNSEWSPVVSVLTTKEPVTGDHLHKMVQRNDRYEVEKIILSRHVPIDVFDKFGYSPLMQASQKGFVDIVELLIEHGADINLQNESGKTSLMLACFAGKHDVAEILRTHGASYEQRDKGGSTPLHWAVDGGDTQLINWMIKNGANVDVRDYTSGWTPLIRCAAVGGKASVAKVLIKHGTEVNARDVDGKTALMIAVINGHVDLVALLLDNGADIKIQNERVTRFLEQYVAKHKIDLSTPSTNMKPIYRRPAGFRPAMSAPQLLQTSIVE